MSAPATRREMPGTVLGESKSEIDWQAHPSVNTTDACPYCGTQAIHSQHCKRMCLSCGWFQSCVD